MEFTICFKNGSSRAVRELREVARAIVQSNYQKFLHSLGPKVTMVYVPRTSFEADVSRVEKALERRIEESLRANK